MVQKPTIEKKKRGRPPKFVRDDVIDAAIEVFWTKGVDHVTLDDLEAATGIDRSTLYASFDGKAGLYRDAAQRYTDRTISSFFTPLSDVDDGIDAVIAMIDALRSMLESGAFPTGCLIVNDLSTPSVDAVASQQYLDTLRSKTRSALERAEADGLIAGGDVADLADLVVGGVLGANVTSRAVDRSEAVRGLDALAVAVHRCRIP